MFQDFALLPWATVIRNVAFGLELRGVAASEREAVAENISAKSGCAASSGNIRMNFRAACVIIGQLIVSVIGFGYLFEIYSSNFLMEHMWALLLVLWPSPICWMREWGNWNGESTIIPLRGADGRPGSGFYAAPTPF